MELMTYLRSQWDRAGAVGCVVLGMLCLFLGYLGVSGTPHVAKQTPYIVSGGLAGLFFLGLGALLWLSADLRDEWREVRKLSQQVREAQMSFAALEPEADIPFDTPGDNAAHRHTRPQQDTVATR